MTDIKKISKKTAFVSVMSALCLIISYIEVLFPFSFVIPGFKLGLANIVILFVLMCLGTREAMIVLFFKIFISALLFTGFSSFIFSFSGGILSFLIMTILKKTNIFSSVGISAAGGVFHNIGQLIAAGVVTKSFAVIYYFPTLLLIGTLTGTMIGLICLLLMKKLSILIKNFSS